MNALEMAEAMEGRARVRRKITNRENTGDRLSDQLDQAAAMLRHQQAEIETLKAHTVKELTDEEILIVWISSNFVRYTETGHIDEIFFNKFARAILRKAQKK